MKLSKQKKMNFFSSPNVVCRKLSHKIFINIFHEQQKNYKPFPFPNLVTGMLSNWQNHWSNTLTIFFSFVYLAYYVKLSI
jgi:hypothetical protein